MYFEYKEKNLSVIPLAFGQKYPFMMEWERFCEELPTDHEIDFWEEKYPKNNIGLALGCASNIIAIDVDTDDPELLRKIELILPPSPIRKRGKKGYTSFYRFNEENSAGFKLKPPGSRFPLVEMLSTGNQTVLPPSIHPDTKKPYEWLTIDTLLSFDLELLPELSGNIRTRLEQLILGTNAPEQDPDEPVESRCAHGSWERLKQFVANNVERFSDINDLISATIDYDDNNHSSPITYFEDLSRGHHADKKTNAIKFVTGVVYTINRKRKARKEPPLELLSKASTTFPFRDISIDLKSYDNLSLNENDMPEAIWDYINDYAYRNETAREYCFASLMSSFLVVLGDKISFKPKQNDDYLWTPKQSFMLIGNPSVRKSPAMNCGLDLLKKATKALFVYRKDEIRERKEKIEQLEHQLEVTDKKLKKEIEQNGPTTFSEELTKEKRKLSDDLAELLKNKIDKDYLVNDATIEAILDIMASHQGSYLQVYDEMSGWLKFYEGDNQSSARGHFLSLMNQGVKDYKVSRKNKKLSLDVAKGSISIIGTIQPSEYTKFSNKSDGLLQRFVPIYPEYRPPVTFIDERPNLGYFKEVYSVIGDLLMSDNTKFFDGDTIEFDNDAYMVYMDIDSKSRINIHDHSDSMQAYIQKSMTIFWNICLVFHLFEGKGNTKISGNTARLAQKSYYVLMEHAKKSFDSIIEVRKSEKIREAIKVFSRSRKDTITIGYFSNAAKLSVEESSRLFFDMQNHSILKRELNKGPIELDEKWIINPSIKTIDDPFAVKKKEEIDIDVSGLINQALKAQG